MALTGTGSRRGSDRALVVLAMVVVVAVVVIVLVTSRPTAAEQESLPALQGKGLAWAVAEAENAGFGDVRTHDSLGRDRRLGDERDWQVCFQQPEPGPQASTTRLELGVVRTTEPCPRTDQGRISPAGDIMPDYRDRTAHMAMQSLGERASVRIVRRDQPDDEVSRGLGSWRVCDQRPLAGEPFDGVPATLFVVEYEQRC